MLPDLIGLTFPSNRNPSEGRAGSSAALRGLPDRGRESLSQLGELGLVCGAEHNNLFVTVRDGEVGDLVTGMGPGQ